MNTSLSDLSGVLIPLFLATIVTVGCSPNTLNKKTQMDSFADMASNFQDTQHTVSINRRPMPVLYFLALEEEEGTSVFPTSLPLTPLLEALGGSYVWDRQAGTINITQGDHNARITIGEQIAIRNGYSINLLASPKVVDEAVWIPHVAITRALDVDYVKWDAAHYDYQIYRFQDETDGETELEKAAIDQIQIHLNQQMSAISRDVCSQERSRTYIVGGIGSLSVCEISSLDQSPRDVQILSARQLTKTDTLSNGVVKVIARFSTDHVPSQHLLYPQRGEMHHEIIYFLATREGQLKIDGVIAERSDRSRTGSSLIPFLSEIDFAQIEREWQQDNYYSYTELIDKLSNDFISPTLSKFASNLNSYQEDEKKKILAPFSQSVRQSDGWQTFLGLEGARDPNYTILDATSTQGFISASLVGNWTSDSVNNTPILMEVDLKWEGGGWRFTRIENVRLYANSRELRDGEPQVYEKIANQYVYRSTNRLGWILI